MTYRLDNNGARETMGEFGYILKIKLIELVIRLNVGYDIKRGVKKDSKILNLNN